MNYKKEDLLQQPVFAYFNEICQIPHVSGNEKQLSDHLLSWAKNLGLDAAQDKYHNLYIRKPAAPGYEDAPPIMLQAHIDMVGDQTADSTLNFQTDPIEWIVEGDNITTGGKTTLGADDGIGVAMAMAVLADKSLHHPMLEVAFTTMEEVDFSGADHFHFPIQSNSLINLDGAVDHEILCSSSGGMDANVRLPVQYEAVPQENIGLRVALSGFAGGHSGKEINRGRDNAIAVLGRFLLELKKEIPFTISHLQGGTSYISLSRDAWAELSLKPEDVHIVEEAVQTLQNIMLEEHPVTGKGIHVTCSQSQRPEKAVQPESIITWLVLPTNGIVQMNEMFPTVVASSVNLGLVRLEEDSLFLRFDIRSLPEHMGQFTFERLELLAQLTGANCTSTLSYPSWKLYAQSPLRERAVQVYEKKFSTKPEVTAVHCGLEVGYFFAQKPNLDAICIGPNRWGNHSPSEGMSIESVFRSTDYLIQLLKELK